MIYTRDLAARALAESPVDYTVQGELSHFSKKIIWQKNTFTEHLDVVEALQASRQRIDALAEGSQAFFSQIFFFVQLTKKNFFFF